MGDTSSGSKSQQAESPEVGSAFRPTKPQHAREPDEDYVGGVCAHGEYPVVSAIDTPFGIKDPYAYRRTRTPSERPIEGHDIFPSRG